MVHQIEKRLDAEGNVAVKLPASSSPMPSDTATKLLFDLVKGHPLRASFLRSLFPVDALVAKDQVFVASKADGRTANADLATYTRTNETMVLSGAVNWKQGPQEGRAERVALHQIEKRLDAEGNVAVKLPVESLGIGELLAGGTNAVMPATDLTALVNLFADHLQVSSNLIVIQGSVRIRDETNQLSCDKIIVQSASTNTERTAVAEGHVVVCHGGPDQCLRSDRAVFAEIHRRCCLHRPAVLEIFAERGPRRYRDALHRSREIQAIGDVAAQVTLAGQSSSFLSLFPTVADTNQAARIIGVLRPRTEGG